MRLFWLIFVLIFGLGWGLSHAQVDSRPVVIALFGDSITVGENATSYYSECTGGGNPLILQFRPGFGNGRSNFCTPDRELQRIMLEQNRPAIVVNHGIGGTLTATNNFNGVSRISGNLQFSRQQLPDGKAYFTLILYGTNDTRSGVPPSVVAANINIMVAQARAVGWQPIVGALLPRSGVDVRPWNTQIRFVASAAGVPFVDHYTNFPADPVVGNFSQLENEDNLGFGFLRLHPTQQGYTTVAQHWFDAALQSLVEAIPEPESSINLTPIIMLLLDEDEQP